MIRRRCTTKVTLLARGIVTFVISEDSELTRSLAGSTRVAQTMVRRRRAEKSR